MSATVLYMSMSLDGFIARANESPDNSLGTGAKPDHRRPREGETDGKDHPEPEHVARRAYADAGPDGRPVQVQGLGRGLRRRSEGGRFALESAQKSEALLLGRVTYEAMQAFWPTAEVSSPTG